MRVGDPEFDSLVEMRHSLGRRLAEDVDERRCNLPDPATHPASAALACAFIYQTEIYIRQLSRGADGLLEELSNSRPANQELTDLQDWILEEKPDSRHIVFTEKLDDTIGDWYVSVGRSYSETKRLLRQMKKNLAGKGAPSKRRETVKMLDARIAKGWSYSQLAKELCDCGATRHTDRCADSIRKRIKELEMFLDKRKISYRP